MSDEKHADSSTEEAEIAKISELFLKKSYTIEQIGELIGRSKETVRKRLIRHLGKEHYASILKSRYQKKKSGPEILQTDAAIKLLKDRNLHFSAVRENTSYILHRMMETAKKAGVHLLMSEKWPLNFKFYLTDRREIAVRAAFARQELNEYRMGFYRFKVLESISKYDYAIFSTCYDEDVYSYVFRTSEIKDLRSLNLRFRPSARRSKYDFALNRWSLLSGKDKSK